MDRAHRIIVKREYRSLSIMFKTCKISSIMKDNIHLNSTLQLTLPTITSTTYLSSPPRQRSTSIHLDCIPRDMCTRLTTQKQYQPAKVTRLANPPSRLSRRQRIGVFLEPKIRHAAGEDTGADDVDHNVFGGELRGLHFGQVDTRRFCWAV